MTMDAGWDLVNEDARAWASQYSYDLVGKITTTRATLLQGLLSDYISGKLTYRDMIVQLAGPFGSSSANLIATTETTRAFSEGNRMAWQRTGVIEYWSWQTANDERVCPICDGLDGEVFDMDAPMPPAHPACRCYTAPSVDGPS